MTVPKPSIQEVNAVKDALRANKANLEGLTDLLKAGLSPETVSVLRQEIEASIARQEAFLSVYDRT